MSAGSEATAAAIAGLDTYLVTVIDHGLNASTFAARVVASTQAGLTSSVLAALGALKGPLHGGAPGPVLDMLDAIGTPANARRLDRVRRSPAATASWASATASTASATRAPTPSKARSRRLKATAPTPAASSSPLRSKRPPWPPSSGTSRTGRSKTNVEFYTALLLEALGFPRDAFTAVFATGRIGGWIAHAREASAAS